MLFVLLKKYVLFLAAKLQCPMQFYASTQQSWPDYYSSTSTDTMARQTFLATAHLSPKAVMGQPTEVYKKG